MINTTCMAGAIYKAAAMSKTLAWQDRAAMYLKPPI